MSEVKISNRITFIEGEEELEFGFFDNKATVTTSTPSDDRSPYYREGDEDIVSFDLMIEDVEKLKSMCQIHIDAYHEKLSEVGNGQ